MTSPRFLCAFLATLLSLCLSQEQFQAIERAFSDQGRSLTHANSGQGLMGRSSWWVSRLWTPARRGFCGPPHDVAELRGGHIAALCTDEADSRRRNL